MSSPYRVLGRTLLPLLRWRVSRVDGIEHLPSSGGFILAANHQSWVDSPMLASALHEYVGRAFRFVAQSSKYRVIGGIPINEYDPSSVLEVAAGYLRAGHPLVIFPEGNSNPRAELRVGKTGAARLASYSGVPIVPVGIRGTQGVTTIGGVKWLLSWWKSCRVVVGPALTFERIPDGQLTKELLDQATEKIMAAISAVSGKPYHGQQVHRPTTRGATLLQKILRRVILPSMRFRVRVSGAEYLPPHGPFIIAANHTSYFDPGSVMIAVWQARRIQPFFLTKGAIADTWKRLLGDQAWHILGMLPIDKTDKAKVLRAAESHLRRDGVIGIFPEGTRNKPAINPRWETEMLRGKTGVARLALATGASVVPAGIFPPRGFGIRETVGNVVRFWKPVRIVFGPPLAVRPNPDPTKDQLDELTQSIMRQIAGLCHKTYPY